MLTIPLSASSEYLLIAELYDFFPNGYKIIRIEDITSIKHGESEKFVEEIIKKENIQIIYNLSSRDLTSWHAIFNWLALEDRPIIIESEMFENPKFYIGKIINIKTGSIELLQFDGAGVWYKKSTTILYKKISSITFNDKYSLLMSKYARNKDKK